MATVSLERLTKVYAKGAVAVRELDLFVNEGEFMVLVGPSGCGKTTALRMVAGLEDITSGRLRIGGRVVNGVPPKGRDIAMVFQNYALYPHMSVAENIGLPLRLRKVSKAVIREKVSEAVAILGLEDYVDRKPGELSGGQRQRVAMGRAIVREPSVFLMDEPLSNLDAKLRVQMRAEVSKIQRRLGVATLYVTHDQIEAMTMGDRVAIMSEGVLQQCGSPLTVYEHPANLFVASFIGSPSMNMYEGALSEDGASLHIGSQAIAISEEVIRARPRLRSFAGRKLAVGIRPEHLTMGEADLGCQMLADIELVEALGPELLVHFRLDARQVQGIVNPLAAEDLGDLSLTTTAKTLSRGVARAPADASVRAGDRVSFRVETSRLHFFDLDSGVSLELPPTTS